MVLDFCFDVVAVIFAGTVVVFSFGVVYNFIFSSSSWISRTSGSLESSSESSRK